ncbi:mCG1050990 [Mus musculus]|nr:mCG1050990 [Mus musculus]
MAERNAKTGCPKLKDFQKFKRNFGFLKRHDFIKETTFNVFELK